MSDDTSKRPQDGKRVNMEQEYEVKYWTERFGVSREQLQEAVRAAGPMVDAVERRLKPAKPANEKRERDRGNVEHRPSSGQLDTVHGEGNYKAAREFDDAQREFVQSGKFDEAIRNAAPESEAEKQELERAEELARRRAKEEDPALLKKQQQSPPGMGKR